MRMLDNRVGLIANRSIGCNVERVYVVSALILARLIIIRSVRLFKYLDRCQDV